MRILPIAVAALAFTGAAYAQSTTDQPQNPPGIVNPAVPGSGYPIPQQTQAPPRPVDQPVGGTGIANPAVPGSGYQVPEGGTRQVPATPKGEGAQDPSVPGSGYSTK